MIHSRKSPLLLLAIGSAGIAAPVETHRFRLTDNLIFLPLEVDRHAGMGVLDTGTSGVAIDEGFARAAGIPKGRYLGAADVSGTRRMGHWQTTLGTLDLPGARMRHVPAIVLDTSAYSKSSSSRVDGIVGLPFFENRIVAVNYPARTVTVANGPLAHLQCSSPVRFKLVDGTPVIEALARFDTSGSFQRLRLMVDLGTRHRAMLLGTPFVATPAGQRLQRASPPVQVASGAGGPVMGWSSRATKLTIGDQTYRQVPFSATSQLNSSSTPPYGTLGVPFWKSGEIQFDYARKLICLPHRGLVNFG